MDMLALARANLLSPLLLCFVLGAFATLVRSDLRFPEPVFSGLSIYLMLSIGLRGGVELGSGEIAHVVAPALAALALGCAIPLWCFALLRWMRFGVADAAALAAHYGSVSAVTFVAVLAYLDATGIKYDGYVAALLALMEVPAIVVALVLAQWRGATAGGAAGGGATGGQGGSIGRALRDAVTGKSVLLLAGGLLIGWLAGPAGYAPVKPVFGDLYRGLLCLFMLELGLLAAARLKDFRKVGAALAVFAVVMPVLHAALGLVVARAVGMGMGGGVVLATLAASASYIAAPAAIRLALPQANPSYYLTASLAITFPFNLVAGIPLYAAMAGWVFR